MVRRAALLASLGWWIDRSEKAKTPAGSWRYLDKTSVIDRDHNVLKVIMCRGKARSSEWVSFPMTGLAKT
jgi:hypothetical protein